MERFFKTEGTITYPDKTSLTWGPFYFYNGNRAKAKMEDILQYIVEWVNSKEPSLDIKPENLLKTRDQKQIIFKIKAWLDEEHLENCDGIITAEEIFFEE